MNYFFQSNAMYCVMAKFFPLRNCNIMYYIMKMHVMPITFQLLLHYNKFLQAGHFQTLLQDYQTIITTTTFLEFLEFHILL